MFAQELSMSEKQMDLFLFSDDKVGFNRVKKQPCLDCGDTEMKLIFNDQTSIYEGFRTCENCRKAYKRRYYSG